MKLFNDILVIWLQLMVIHLTLSEGNENSEKLIDRSSFERIIDTHFETLRNNWDNSSASWNSSLLMSQEHSIDKQTLKIVLETSEKTENDINSFGAFDRHPCRRVCQQGQSLKCYYRLVVHDYQRLGPECQRCKVDMSACEADYCIYGDGVPTIMKAVNRQQPAPPLEVCENDTIVIDLLNYLTQPTTMHFHGFKMFLTPEMDGVPFVTQYPVQPAEVFRYSFTADHSGTNWYHSHVHWQRAMGIAGAFIVRQTRQANRHAHLYDYDLVDHTLLIYDIFYNYDYDRVSNILINGKGRNHLNTWPDSDSRHRYERVSVTPGYRYRMRVIYNGVFNCPIEFSIENHKLLIISTDGNDIQPLLADSFFMASAERFDFILEANQIASNYWIRVRGFESCSDANLYQGAVLHYRGAKRNIQPQAKLAEFKNINNTSPTSTKFVINYFQSKISRNTIPKDEDTTNVPTAALRSLNPLPWPRYTAFLTYYSSFSMRTDRNGRKLFQIDDVTFAFPMISLLQGHRLFDDNSYFCNRSSLLYGGRNCRNENCECTNVIRLPAYKPIELVIANHAKSPHPFHIHGYTFRLVGQGEIGNEADLRRIQDLDRRGLLQRTPPDFPAVEKDSIQIPALGYVIVRFISDNPGYWFYHCHIESHVLNGMGAILKVGEIEQIKKLPPKIRC